MSAAVVILSILVLAVLIFFGKDMWIVARNALTIHADFRRALKAIEDDIFKR